MTRLGFLVYDSRSGSTLLAALLNRLAGVSVSHESRFVARVLEHAPERIDLDALTGINDLLAEEVQYRELRIDHADVVARLRDAPAPWNPQQVIDALLASYFERRDAAARVRVVKSARSLLHAPTLLRLYPNAFFLHIVRDGRAVFASKRRSRSTGGAMMETNPLKAAREWRERIERSARLGPALIQIRYEDLIEDPQREIEKVATELRLSDAERMRSKPQDDYALDIGDAQAHLHARVASTPDPSRATAWKDEIADIDVAIYQRIAGDALAACGYPLIDTGLSASRVTAASGAAWLDMWLRRAGRILRLARRPGRLAQRLAEVRHERAA